MMTPFEIELLATTNAADSITVQRVKPLKIGEIIRVKFDIADERRRSHDKDDNEIVPYSAPPGMVILDDELFRTGHNSGVSVVRVEQAGEVSYETGVVANLLDKISEGFLKGSFTWKGVQLGEADLAGKYADFLKEFSARYEFRATTNSRIFFKWTTRTKRGRYGASIKAFALIRLMRVPVEDDAARALAVIKFAIESGESNDLFDLLDRAFGGRTSVDLDIKPDPVEEEARLELDPDEPPKPQTPTSSDACEDVKKTLNW